MMNLSGQSIMAKAGNLEVVESDPQNVQNKFIQLDPPFGVQKTDGKIWVFPKIMVPPNHQF